MLGLVCDRCGQLVAGRLVWAGLSWPGLKYELAWSGLRYGRVESRGMPLEQGFCFGLLVCGLLVWPFVIGLFIGNSLEAARMLSTQLNGGPIAKYRPIGHEGQPIYKNAEAFIAALKLYPSVGEKKAQCLAVPRISADGLNIDWYVPFSPKHPGQEHNVIAWNSASPQEQQQALALLQDLEQSLRKLGAELQRRGAEGQSKLMASYLTGQNTVQNLPAIHFPGPEYVYIVDGIPVITFWGFENKDDDLKNSPLEILRKRPSPDYVAPSATFAAQQNGNGQPPFNNGSFNTLNSEPPASAYVNEQAQPYQGRGHVCPLLGITIPPCLFNFCLGLLALALLLALLWFLLPRLGIGLPFGLSGCSGHPVVVDSPVTASVNSQDPGVVDVTGTETTGSEVIGPEAPVVDATGTASDVTLVEPGVPSETAEVIALPEVKDKNATGVFYLPDLDWASLNLPYALKGKFVGLDLDGDGVIDAADINGDGLPDTYAEDTNQDGNVDLTGFDFNQDGITDSIGVDLDKDGQLDTIAMDLTGDNFADALDFDGDGKPDLFFDQLKRSNSELIQVPTQSTNILLPTDGGQGNVQPDGVMPDAGMPENTGVTDGVSVGTETILSDGQGDVLGDGNGDGLDNSSGNGLDNGLDGVTPTDIQTDTQTTNSTDSALTEASSIDSQVPPEGMDDSGLVFTEESTPSLDGTNSGDAGAGADTGVKDGAGALDNANSNTSQVAANNAQSMPGDKAVNPPSLPPVDPKFTENTTQADNAAQAQNSPLRRSLSGAKMIGAQGANNSVQHNLQFTPQAIQSQGTKVLDGQWNTRSALMDSSNGRPLQMGYSMKDGKGQVEIIRADGVKCVAPAQAITSGNGLAIQASGQAVCPDHRSYTIPQIECQAAANGTVKCNGKSGNSEFPIQLYAR